ncbi:MAG: hypothetical protein EX269_13740 [Acidimicrobiales bacterium]|nr:MAG: hypothetical protein EX269_13740 [Acidimicrobiales bacterium]
MIPSPTRFRALTRLAVLAAMSTVLYATPGTAAAAVTPDVTCFGLTASQAEAQGYRVQVGTDGNDFLFGGNASRDFIMGFGGDDVITGAGNNDILCGGLGHDIITAGSGDDRVSGGLGNDEMDLGSGDDLGRGKGGLDRLVGGAGDDILDGGRAADRISGELGNDRIFGGGGPDIIYAGEGHDRVSAGPGNDRASGGPGRDIIAGGTGADIVSGNDGRDRIQGGNGNDILDGDGNLDRIRGGAGIDRCNDSDGDLMATCETDLGGRELPQDDPVELIIPDPQPEPQPDPEPQPNPDPQPDPEPDPDPEPPPVDEGPVPADQAPQGVNRYGWPLLTDAGLAAMLECESGTNHAINTGNGFYGGVQWLPATWNAAARGSGFTQYDGVLPHLVPAQVQDDVTKWWWEATRPNTQWPHCHVKALAAMNVLPPT